LLVAGSVFALLGPPPSSANDVAPDEEAAVEDPDTIDEPDPGDDPGATPPADPTPPTAEPDDEPDPDEGTSPDEGTEPDTPDTGFDPATISVQVLDGYQLDGGDAANAIAEQLRTAGYDIIAENPAIAYEVTTVLWTAGFEAQARQVAEEIGAAEVREQPGNLSTQVAVHVVVGADRG
jgi:hypothetical protein